VCAQGTHNPAGHGEREGGGLRGGSPLCCQLTLTSRALESTWSFRASCARLCFSTNNRTSRAPPSLRPRAAPLNFSSRMGEGHGWGVSFTFLLVVAVGCSLSFERHERRVLVPTIAKEGAWAGRFTSTSPVHPMNPKEKKSSFVLKWSQKYAVQQPRLRHHGLCQRAREFASDAGTRENAPRRVNPGAAVRAFSVDTVIPVFGVEVIEDP
jgi:hypothetical protein